MKAYGEMNREELLALQAELEASYAEAKGQGLKLTCPGENRPNSSWICRRGC